MTCSRTGRRPPDRLRLTVDSLAFGGDAVGRDEDGRVVFVPGGAPGDVVEAIVEEEKKGYARASLGRVLTPSPDRVEPPCPLFRDAECGGCQWQHVADGAQRRAKEDIVRRALRHVIDGVEPIVAPAPPYGWRRRARMRWRRLGDGRVLLGYAARRSHRIVDVNACPQLEPALEAALLAVRGALLERLHGSGDLHLLLGARGAVHVVIEAPGARGLADAARGLVGVEGIAGVVLRDGEGDVLGAAAIALDEDEPPLLVSADSFAQASAGGNRALRRAVMAAAWGTADPADPAGPLAGCSVLELYAGSGNFTRDLVAAGAHVTAVEEHPGAVSLARRSLPAQSAGAPSAGAPGVVLVADSAEAAVARLAAEGARFDLFLVDPPRTGLAAGLPRSLAALAPRGIYVSCDPNTLARDLAAFAAAGHRTLSATPFDLMPQTFHVEVVATLQGIGTCAAKT